MDPTTNNSLTLVMSYLQGENKVNASITFGEELRIVLYFCHHHPILASSKVEESTPRDYRLMPASEGVRIASSTGKCV